MRRVDQIIRARAAELIAARPSMPNAVALVNAAFYLGPRFDPFAPGIVEGMEREAAWRASR